MADNNGIQVLSNDIHTITAEINAYQRVAGEAIFEIGRRLKHVKENDLSHGEFGKWLETVSMKPRQAQRFMKVFERFGKATPVTYFELGMSVLYELADFTDEELGTTMFRNVQHTSLSIGIKSSCGIRKTKPINSYSWTTTINLGINIKWYDVVTFRVIDIIRNRNPTARATVIHVTLSGHGCRLH